MYTKAQIKAAFDTPAAERTPEQRAICEYQLPALPPRDPNEREKEAARRYIAGLPLSHYDRRLARRYLKSKG